MLNKEVTIEQACDLINKGRIVYVVIYKNKIDKVFTYHTEAWEYCMSKGTPSLDYGYRYPAGEYYIHYNITHPKCPRFAKIELGYVEQLDLFLDYPWQYDFK